MWFGCFCFFFLSGCGKERSTMLDMIKSFLPPFFLPSSLSLLSAVSFLCLFFMFLSLAFVVFFLFSNWKKSFNEINLNYDLS